MERVCVAGVRVLALFMGACALRFALPEGGMKHSAQKALDIAVLYGLINVISEALNG